MEHGVFAAEPTGKIDKYVELNEILENLPISKSTWRRGVKSGRYPKPYQISPGRKAWKLDELQACTRNFHHC